MDQSISLTIFSSVAVVSCLFMMTYFIVIRKENKVRDLSLGLLFFAIAIRIAKSIFTYSLINISYFGMAFGLLGIAVMGPLILLYFRYSTVKTDSINSRFLLHLIFPIGAFIIMFLPNRKARDIYFIATIGLGVYLAVIAYKYMYSKSAASLLLTTWHKALYYAMVGLFSLFLLQMFNVQ